jgi:hypothetical protein
MISRSQKLGLIFGKHTIRLLGNDLVVHGNGLNNLAVDDGD